MTHHSFSRWWLPLWAALASGAALAHLSPDAQAGLQALLQQPELAGELIYTGTVRSIEEPHPRVLLHYQRRVAETGNTFTATHLSLALDGTALLSETAQYDANYAVQRFESSNRRLFRPGSGD